MIDYVEGNVHYVNSYLEKNIPQIKAILPEASFWYGWIVVHCTFLNLSWFACLWRRRIWH